MVELVVVVSNTAIKEPSTQVSKHIEQVVDKLAVGHITELAVVWLLVARTF